MAIISDLDKIEELYTENEDCIIISKDIIKAINEFMLLGNPTCQKSEVLLNSLYRLILTEERKEYPRTVIYNEQEINNYKEFLKSFVQDKDDRFSKMFNKIESEIK